MSALPKYPFDIPSIHLPSDEEIDKIEPWEGLEFLRIEALLRSESVAQLYRDTYSKWNKDDTFTDSLFIEHSVIWGWHVLEGVHQVYLHPELLRESNRVFGLPHEQEGVWDLSEYLSDAVKAGKTLSQEVARLGRMISQEDPRYMWVRIDVARPPHTILRGLEKRLKAIHETLDIPVQKFTVGIMSRQDRFAFVPFHPKKSPPIIDLKSWERYLRCYDIRRLTGRSYGEIGKEVYKSGKAYERARKAVSRVDQLIKCAESGDWPPPKLI